MTTAAATTAPTPATPAAARPAAHGKADPAAPADLFAQLLADLRAAPDDAQADTDPTSAPGPDTLADSAGQPDQDALADDPKVPPGDAIAALWGTWPPLPGTPAVAQAGANAPIVNGPGTEPPGLLGAATAERLAQAVGLHTEERPTPQAAAVQGRHGTEPGQTSPGDAPAGVAGGPPGRARAKTAPRAGAGQGPAPDAGAARSDAALTALREAAGHAGVAHGLRALVGDGTPSPAGPAAGETATAGAATPTPSAEGSQPRAGDHALPGHAAPHGAPHGPGGNTGGSGAAVEITFGQRLEAALQQTVDALGAELALWSAGDQQRASLTFDDETWDTPLAVDVQLDAGLAHLTFRSDDAATRQLIQAQAPQVLADALARAGLTLGQLDVGTRQGQGQGEAAAGAPRAARIGAAVASAAVAAHAQGPRPATPRGALDVYA
ncbi:MAG: flagellar hook-length control protein FliK [Tepidimonas ignava]